MKTAILIFSDPKSGEEALGRAFNALGLARESALAGDDVAIEFVGAGTRWLGEVAKLDHPLHGLFQSVREHVAGASCGCAKVFGAEAGAAACGVPLKTENPLPGTPGVSSIRHYLANGYQTLVF